MAKKSLGLTSLDGFSWLFSSSIGKIVAKIGILAVLARLVTPAEFGLIGAATIVVTFAKMFTEIGMGPALVQRKELDNIHVYTAFSTSLVLAFICYLFLYLLAPVIASFFNMPPLIEILKILGIIFLIEGIAVVSQSQVQRNLYFKWMAITELITYIIGYGIVGTLMAYFGYGVWALVGALIVQSIVKMIFYLIKSPVNFKLKFDFIAFKELWYFGGGFTLSKIGNYLANVGDNIVIGRYLGEAALGFYSRAHSLMVAPTQPLGSALDKVIFPVMSSIQGDTKKMSKAYLHGVGIFSIISLPISVYFVLFANEIVLVLLGEDWVEVILPLQVMACGLIFRLGYKMSGSLTKALGVVYERAWRQGLYAILIFTLAWIGHFWGIEGAALGTVVAITANYFMMAQLSIKMLNIDWVLYFRRHLLGILMALICVFPAFYLNMYLDYLYIGNISKLLISSILFAFIYFFLIWICYFFKLNKDVDWFIKLAKQKMDIMRGERSIEG